MIISLIAAMGKNRVIGYEGKMPWHLPADLQHFKQITTGKPIIMGRKTYDSIGKALPNRSNIIVSSHLSLRVPDCQVASTPENALNMVSNSEEVIIIGGSTLYQHFLPRAQRLYLTFIDSPFPGDTFFPEWDQAQWQEKEHSFFEADNRNPYDYRFVTLERK